MSVLEAKANQIADDAGQKNGEVSQVALDPFTISVIVQILTSLVKAYMACRKTPEEAAVSMRDPGVLDRWRLRRTVKQHLDHDEAHDLLAGPVFKSTLKVAAGVTDDEVKSMYDEVRS